MALPSFLDETLSLPLGKAMGASVGMTVKSTHAVLTIPAGSLASARAALAEIDAGIRVMSRGDTLEIYKEVGLPKDVAARFDISAMHGTHGIGHPDQPDGTTPPHTGAAAGAGAAHPTRLPPRRADS